MSHPSIAAFVAAASFPDATARAEALSYPTTIFGFTPEQPEYWEELSLPWLTQDMLKNHQITPLDYRGWHPLLCIGYMASDSMAPRFPLGCGVQSMPVYDKKNLVVGRVYTYRYWDEETQKWTYEMARLVKIGGNYLEVKADNRPTPSMWLLREESGQEVWEVREVTHYASYPSEEEEARQILRLLELQESATPLPAAV